MSDADLPIQPLTDAQRHLVVRATHACVLHAEQLYQRAFGMISVRFDLSGRTAGMYRVRRGARMIRYNPYIFAKYFDDGLAQTVPHEVAHYITDIVHGLRKVRPHGPEWRAIAQALGADPKATFSADLSGVPQRRQRLFLYRCNCSEHQLTSRRHNKIHRGEGVYLCRHCRAPLVYRA
ncbi:MAG: SprT-like domain-containing protein [Gammaproteobacteria bacterium]|nr:SprT-like domain-containing protein [Gammaproteobacteria bacterium]